LSSGATRATTPIPSTCSSTSASLSAAKSVPGERSAFDAELVRDRARGRNVIAGDHARADPGLFALRDRVLRFLPRRVDDRHQCEQRELLHLVDQRSPGVERGRVEVTRGDSQHAEPLAREPIVLFHHTPAVVVDRDHGPVHVPCIR
jgi:hypothetical protein